MTRNLVSAARILDLLSGSWWINRKLINNIENDYSGEASGLTELIESDNNTLSYKESVILRLDNGLKMQGRAYYKFCIENGKLHQYSVLTDRDSTIEIHMFELDFYYLNGKIFTTASYDCNDDKYNVEYFFHNDNKLSITYTVLGPNKNYITETDFEKLPAGEVFEFDV